MMKQTRKKYHKNIIKSYGKLFHPKALHLLMPFQLVSGLRLFQKPINLAFDPIRIIQLLTVNFRRP